MKKEYVKPRVTTVDIECENILESSYVDVGGETGSFNARRGRNNILLDDYQDE